jgi:hypothetical protein
LHAGRRARTRLENVIPQEFQMFQTMQWMTGSLRHYLTPYQKNTLRLKRLDRGNIGKGHTRNGNGNGKNSGKGPTIKSLTRSIAALTTKIDKFSLPDDDEDESSEEEEGTSNRSNTALTRQIKNKNRGGNLKANLSAFTMRLGYVGRVEEANRSDLDLHADCCVCGK